MSDRANVAANAPPSISPLSKGGILQRQCQSCGQHKPTSEECPECKKKLLQRKAVNSGGDEAAPPIVEEVLRSPGQPLDAETRRFMESRFQRDFSQVQVHTDAKAAQSARAVHALAYTVGQDIVFAEGEYALNQRRGQQLIAHELTHTVQQRSGAQIAPARFAIGAPSSSLEREADRAAEQVLDQSIALPITQTGLTLQRDDNLVDVDLSATSPEEAGELRKRGVDLPKGSPDKWPLPLIQAVTADCDRIVAKLDVVYYSDDDETEVMKILYRWAFEPNPPDRANLPGSVYLQALFAQLQQRTKSGVTYYDRLFSRSDEYRRDLKALRNYRAPAFKDTADLTDEGVSFELADAPEAAKVASAPAGLTPDYKRVFGWLTLHKAEIVSAESRFEVDRRAIAGAIAWEALENVRGSWTPSSVGPGKIHIRTHKVAGENTVAKQTEDAGYLPQQSFDDRKKLLATPAGAIEYIAAIMKAGIEIAWREKAIEISQNPPILTYFYQSKDLPAWRALIKTKQPGAPLSPGDFSKNMGRWVQIHLPFLEEAVGQPAFKPTHAPARPTPLQRFAAGAAPVRSVPSIVHQVLRLPGQPLTPELRTWMESKLSEDFSQVRIHTDPAAATSAARVHALAYTVNRDIVFGRGQYHPETLQGQSLIAHELAHVMQQRHSPALSQNQLTVDSSQAHEQQADALADAVMQNRPAPPFGSAPASLMKQDAGPDAEKPIAGVPDTDRGAATDQAAPDVVTPPAPVAPPPKLVPLPTPAVPCPAAPTLAPIPASCPTPTVTAGVAPPAKETAPPLPVLSEAAFGGNATIAEFAKKLAACRAGRTVQAEVDLRYKNAIEQAKKQSDAEAKVDKDKAIADAVAATKAALEGTSKPKVDQEVAKARKEAATKADKEAQQKKAQAVAAVSKPNLATVQAELQTKYEAELAADFKLTMQRVLAEYGSGWQNTMLNRIKQGKDRKAAELKKKPVVKKNETPPPERSAAEINAALETHLVQLRCEQQNWAANQFEGFKRGWMVGRREEVDFDTLDQGPLKPLGKDFKPPREVPTAERVEIPEDLRSSKEAMPGVAPEVVGFLRALQKLEPDFTASNYSGHGGGSWAGQGFSLDLYLVRKNAGKDDRGFWQHQAAVDFLLNLDKAAKAAGAEWRVLYNDFSVAQEVNRTTGKKNVTFTGNIDKGGHVNWHGPDPLKLHFHLDIAPIVSP